MFSINLVAIHFRFISPNGVAQFEHAPSRSHLNCRVPGTMTIASASALAA